MDDLFAAFGQPAPALSTHQQLHPQSQDDDIWNLSAPPLATTSPQSQGHSTLKQPPAEDDDWGDFEDASAVGQSNNTVAEKPSTSHPVKDASRTTFPPKAQKRDEPPTDPHSKIGKHPFAGHMDFLFEGGDDEYDAGADDLDNLANNPAAASAFSKRIIAEQEARAQKATSLVASSSKVSNASALRHNHDSRSAKSDTNNKLPKPVLPSQAQQIINPPPARKKLQKKSGYAPAKDPDILFDADNPSEEEDEGDDFGDFEGESIGPALVTTPAPEASAPAIQPAQMPNIDLLGLDTTPKPLGAIGRSRSASMKAADAILGPPKHTPTNSLGANELPADDNPWADFDTVSVPAKHTPSASKPTNSIPLQDDSGWDDFVDFETSEPVLPTVSPAAGVLNDSAPATHSRAPFKQEPSLPPTNIPPPVILLSAFPSLFSSAQEALFNPLSKLDTVQRQQLLLHPATHQFLKTYINHSTVLARIIAGRKLRWKRDQILAQSMRIGPAAAGGKGGMKLTGIDKSEVAKEEREVLDAVRLWKTQAGKLRGAATGASTGSKLPLVPEIAEQMPVRSLKAVEGGFVAPHPCALCGLKREERIAKVDVDVDDSFGEWWVGGTDMHLTCKAWWDEYKGKLKSR